MKAIILAAGRGTRMRPITDSIPKPLISIIGKPILEHNLEHIYTYVDEIIIIIKYLGEQIQEYFGDSFKGTKITYYEQGELKGTGGALMGLDIKDDVFVIYGDQILEKKDYQKILSYKGYGALVKEVSTPEKYGIYEVDKNNIAAKMIEKPKNSIGNLANIGGFKFSEEIFTYLKKTQLSQRGEYEITDALNMFIENNTFKVFVASGDFIDVGCPEDIKKAEEVLKKQLYTKPKCGEYKIIEEIGDYKLSLGIPKEQIDSLIEYSQDLRDVELQENTGDLKRFSSKGKFQNWYNDTGRYLFCMLDRDSQLAGIYWGRPTKMPNIKKVINEEVYNKVMKNQSSLHTNGIRIYPKYRGQRLAKVLFQAEKHYENIFSPCYWSTDVSEENIASCKGFERGGYIHMANGKNINNGKQSDDNRRIYIKLPQ